MNVTTVRVSDLRHILDVYIENGMVESEDVDIIDRLWRATETAESQREAATTHTLSQAVGITVVDSENDPIDLRLFNPSRECPVALKTMRTDGNAVFLTLQYLHDQP